MIGLFFFKNPRPDYQPGRAQFDVKKDLRNPDSGAGSLSA
jgi:hypothetical protein